MNMTTITKPEVFLVTKGSQREYCIHMFKREIESANSNLEKFREEMVKDPVRAFTWADSSFEAAAKHGVCTQILSQLKSGENLENICETLTHSIMHGAKYVPSSTSRSSNYTKLCQTAQEVEAFNMFRGIKDLEKIL